MAVLRQIEMTGPEEAAAVQQGDGVVTFGAMFNVPDMLAVKLESGGEGVPYVEYALGDGSDFDEPTLGMLIPLALDDTGSGGVSLIEFRSAVGDVKCALVWQMAGQQLQLWSSGYGGIITGTTTQLLDELKLYWAQITVGTGATATVRLRIYSATGALIFDSGNRTADTGLATHARVRLGCLNTLGTGAVTAWFAGPTTITDGEQIAPEEELLGDLTAIVPEADTEVAGNSSNLNVNFGANPSSGAGEFTSSLELVRALRRDNLAGQLSGPSILSGRTILRARIRRITSQTHQPGNNREYSVHRMLAHWEEMEATGAVRLTGVPWSGGICGEGDYDPEPIATSLGPRVVGEVIYYDVTAAVRAVIAEGGTKLDTLTRVMDERGIANQRTGCMWWTKEAEDPSLWPLLLIESEAAPMPPGPDGRARQAAAVGIIHNGYGCRWGWGRRS